MVKKTLFILLLTLIFTKAFSAVFVVTSNADSGPGTLRDALTQAAANGSATTDYINFNLADLSVAGRTIVLESELPYVSSNLIIDGTTQPGADLNMGDAKVIITVDVYQYVIPLYSTGALTINGANNAQIYGLSINRFYYLRNNFDSGALINAAIIVINSQNIAIGAPGKGNYFSNNDYSIYAGATDYTKDDSPVGLTIQSNYFFDPPILSYVPKGVGIFAHNVLFGGDGSLEGNHLLGNLAVDGTSLQIVHNYFGIDKNGAPVNYYFPLITSGSPYTNDEVIRNNTSNFLSIQLQNINNFKIYANTDIADKTTVTGGIFLNSCSNGIIGSDDINQQNILHGNNYALEISNNNSNNIQILKNSIICSAGAYSVSIDNAPIVIPGIKVVVNSSTEFSGTASPNSDIYVYEDNTDCPICNPVVFYTKVIADANGAWKITGNFLNKKLLANALLNQNSSEFTEPHIFYSDNNIIKQPTCGLNNGSIALSGLKNILKLEWYNSNDQKIGEGVQINNLGPGRYYAIGSNGNCKAKSDSIYLYNVQPLILDNNKVITNPSCGKGGSITGLITTTNSQNAASFKWTDQTNNVVGNSPDISNLPAGEYTLTMTDDVSQCSVTYGPVILKNISGPTVDKSYVNIASSDCGQTAGSVTGLIVTGTGTIKYTWTNSSGQVVAQTKDLTNQPYGTYTLQVSDDSQCNPVVLSFEILETHTLIISETKELKITMATCGEANGSITGLYVSGGQYYAWTDGSGKVVGNNTNLLNVGGGDYQLTLSNSCGNMLESQVYHIDQQDKTIYPNYQVSVSDVCPGGPNGGIAIVTDTLVKSARWVNSQGQTIGNSTQLPNVSAGTYQVYFTDQNGCETLYKSYTVNQITQLQIDNSAVRLSNDQCSLKQGSIVNLQITGGEPPYAYTWTNANGEIISASPDLTGLSAGDYTLSVKDGSSCNYVSQTYTVLDLQNPVSAPSVSNVDVCSPGEVFLAVNNPDPNYVYRLYSTDNNPIPLDVQKSGTFKVNVEKKSILYVSQSSGSCESSRTAVQISVGISNLNIANTITPNGDGINDYWNIKGIENYPSAFVQVFTRYGQKVFESHGYAHPFDGTSGGKPLPVGVYYYIINLNSSCNLLTGNLTILR